MEKEQSTDLLQEVIKHEPIYRESSDNVNLTGLSKNQVVPLYNLEKFQSINRNSYNNFQPEKSNYFLGHPSLSEDNNSNIFNIFKPSDCNNNNNNNNSSLFPHNLLQISSSNQDLNSNNGVGWLNLNLLGSSFPQTNNLTQTKTNKSPLGNLNFQVNGENSLNNQTNNNNNNGNGNNNNNNNNNNYYNNLNLNASSSINNSSSILNSNDNSNQSNKSIGNGIGKGISSNNSNFNFNLSSFNRPFTSNEQFPLAFMSSGFNNFQHILSNDAQQNKESFTKISSSSSSSRTHSAKRGTTIIIQAQQNLSPAIVNKQGSDSNQQENISNQHELFNQQKLICSDQLKLTNSHKQIYEQLLAEKIFDKDNTNLNQIDNSLFSLNNPINSFPKQEEDIKIEEQQQNNEKKVKKSARISKKQNLSGEEKEPSKKRKTDKPVDHNFSDETQGLNYEDNQKQSKSEIKIEEEKKEKYNIKKEQIDEEENNEQVSESEVKPVKNNEKAKNIDGQEKKSSSRQSQHKNVYKNFGKELLRFVRSKQQHCQDLNQEEFQFLLEQLTGGLNDKDTKQTLPIQKKEKLQLLWTLKVEQPLPASNHKKTKNDPHNKNNEDKSFENDFITEKDDEISAVDSIDLKTKKYFRKISWEFFNEWAFQYVMSSRKLDKKEIHLKCIPSFLFGIMCPKSLEVFKPIRENDKNAQQNTKQPNNSTNNLS